MEKTNLTPELRFKKEDGTDYPNWEEKRLGEIGNIIGGLTYKPSNISINGVLVLRSSNIKNNRLVFENNVYVKADIPEKMFIYANDILVCVRNGSKSLIGKSVFIRNSIQNTAFGAFMTVYRSGYNNFISHYFQSEIIQRQIRNNIGATINQITNNDFKNLTIQLPTLEEQEKIAGVLSSADRLIEQAEEELNSLKAYKKSLMQKLFPKHS